MGTWVVRLIEGVRSAHTQGHVSFEVVIYVVCVQRVCFFVAGVFYLGLVFISAFQLFFSSLRLFKKILSVDI